MSSPQSGVDYYYITTDELAALTLIFENAGLDPSFVLNDFKYTSDQYPDRVYALQADISPEERYWIENDLLDEYDMDLPIRTQFFIWSQHPISVM